MYHIYVCRCWKMGKPVRMVGQNPSQWKVSTLSSLDFTIGLLASLVPNSVNLVVICCDLYFSLHSRHVAGPSSGRQWWREWRLWSGPSTQFPKLLQSGLWTGFVTAGPWKSNSSSGFTHPWWESKLASFTPPQVVLNLYEFLLLDTRYLEEFREPNSYFCIFPIRWGPSSH